ncbi:MAG TPA: NAD-dependent succinate-semialdehyde dehydrogenase [Baekduia sp.]|uniref:NAD-dependent succinate-semialdehyde dehydrogenase n=1 Tax=Baekduia sp. TaxID=2600305 RepID=UPI002D7955E0|nr:NAD-dependent succinate-semialdehyde dehydrogenase [Baekduia sp.]HET6509104.1 NAD-dependent succinate-semialdehyde dehydrogenase [Baekduia sp.]
MYNNNIEHAALDEIGPKPGATEGQPVESLVTLHDDGRVHRGVWQRTPGTFPSARGRAAAVVGPLLRDRAFVGGRWIEADDGASFAVSDPATGAVVGRVPALGAAETRRAIDSAAGAFGRWAERPAAQRGRLLRTWADRLVERAEALATLIVLEQGKPLAEARAEVAYAAAYLEWFGEEAKRAYGETIPAPERDRRLIVVKQPVGVGAGITPWNFPAAMVARKVAPALAAGCPIVIKPAEQTPLTALALAAIAEEAGLPPGLLHVVTTDRGGAPAVGRELTSNRAVRKLSFTGSTPVGKALATGCAGGVKRVSLELGGNAPFIVFDDADLDAAVDGLLVAKLRNAGQTCVAANRILVHAAVHDELVDRFATAVARLRVGDGLDDGTDLGPLIDARAGEKVAGHLADALDRGATLVAGGDHDGPWFSPAIVTGVTPGMRVASEETFGPLAAITRFDDEDQAIALANGTPFGLVAYVYTRDAGRVWRAGEALEVGMVGVNTGVVSTEVAPFGGVKESGIGREGSRHGLDEWLDLKYMAMGGAGRSLV